MRKLILLFFGFLLIACEKEHIDVPKTYFFSSFETGKVRIFTKNGEIIDEQLSLNLINRWSDYFYNKDSFKFDDFDLNGKITLNPNNQSIIQGRDTTMYYGFKKNNNVIYFESSDTLYSFRDLVNMKDNRFMFGPITQTGTTEGLVTGFPPLPVIWYGFLPCVYALDMGSEIKFPFTSFLEKYCFADNSLSIIGNCPNVNALSNVNNIFNESYLNQIMNDYPISPQYESRDTIVIQENFITFKKQ